MSARGDTQRGEARRERDDSTGRYVEKFSEEVVQRICDVVAAGAPFETAAAYAGVSRQIYYEWLRKGREALAEPRFRDFVERIELAMAQWEVRDLALIGKAAEEHWQAAAWRLERRKPEVYGKRSRVDHANADGQPFEMLLGAKVPAEKLAELSDDELATMTEAVRIAEEMRDGTPLRAIEGGKGGE